MTEKNYIALLTIEVFPQTKRDKTKLAKWLNKVASDILIADPTEYVKKPKFRLTKTLDKTPPR